MDFGEIYTKKLANIATKWEKNIKATCLPGYIFYCNTKSSASQYARCTSCDAVIDGNANKRTYNTADVNYVKELYHNKCGICPRCNRKSVAKQLSYYQSDMVTLFHALNVVAVEEANDGIVLIRCFKVEASYDALGAKIGYTDYRSYVFTAGKYYVFKKQYNSNNYNYAGKNSFCEPFDNSKWYHLLDAKKLLNSQFKYVIKNILQQTKMICPPYDTFRKCYAGHSLYSNTIKLLQLYTKNPKVEMLLKIDANDWIHRMCIDGTTFPKILNYKAKSVHQIFGATKASFKMHRESYLDKMFFTMWKTNFKDYPIDKLDFYYKRVACYNKQDIITRLISLGLDINKTYKKMRHLQLTMQDLNAIAFNDINPNELFRYLTKVNVSAYYYFDYLDAAIKLQYDLSIHNVMFPKNITEAHDRATSAIKIIGNKLIEDEAKESIKKRKKIYEYENETYKIIVPEKIQEIVDEGNALKHCVGGYASRHLRDETTICFMREKDAPENPYITIQVDNGIIRQAHGYKNSEVKTKSAEKAFIDEWLAVVKKRIKKLINN